MTVSSVDKRQAQQQQFSSFEHWQGMARFDSLTTHDTSSESSSFISAPPRTRGVMFEETHLNIKTFLLGRYQN